MKASLHAQVITGLSNKKMQLAEHSLRLLNLYISEMQEADKFQLLNNNEGNREVRMCTPYPGDFHSHFFLYCNKTGIFALQTNMILMK